MKISKVITIALVASSSALFAGEGKGKPSSEEMFQRIDLDGDGMISYAEFEEAKGKFKGKKQGKKGGKKHRNRKHIMERFDANGDGELDEAERAEMEKAKEELKAQFDTDGDGKLSREERQAIREHFKAKREAQKS